ncbi:MAG: DUF3189 family protein [Syntrophomonadaceae bacterium]|nr:DUF3189 family protein [Syntrophomonadaceae bacterium]MDD3022705.1 DUF3189 family protein [Syntrophomonadaceae bacterium]
MKIIFLGTTGVHHSLIAAYVYLQRLPDRDFKMIPGFSDIKKDDSGFPLFIDEDSLGNQVYTLGAGREVLMAQKTIGDLVNVLGFSNEDLVVKPVRIKGEQLLLMLEKISNILGGESISLLLSNYIVQKEFHRILKEVENFRLETKKLHLH